MDRVTEEDQRRALHALSMSDAYARALFTALSARDRDVSETTVDRVMTIVGADRPTAITLMRAVADTGVAVFFIGRRGAKTRLVWSYSCKSVGVAALEAEASLKIAVLDDEGDTSSQMSNPEAKKEGPIARAKRLIAEELGINEGNIEIIVRA